MSPLRESDLTPELRRRAGLPPATSGRRPGGRQVTGGGRWQCATCHVDLTAWAAVERHRTETGHARYAIPLTEDAWFVDDCCAAVERHRTETGHARYAIPLTDPPGGQDGGP